MYRNISRVCGDLISLLFPDLCCACGVNLYRGERCVCSSCIMALPYTDHHRHAENKTAKKFWGRIDFEAAMSMLYFKKGGRVQNIIHQLKYGNDSMIGLKLGAMMAERIKDSAAFEQIDLIIPIPLHKKRQRARGYNQSGFIAEGIAGALHIPVKHEAVIRQKATKSQTNKSSHERFENMRDVFKVVDGQGLNGKHILLVDDVITTGATIASCANELRRCGIGKLSIAAVAYAD
jgi:ComF family protein